MRPLPLLPALALAIAAAGCGGARPAAEAPLVADDGTPVVALWSADTLSLAEFEDVYTATDGLLADTVQSPLERRRDFLERYVDFRLKVLAARAAGYDRDSSYLAEIADYRDQLAGPYFTDRQVLDDIVRDIYEKQAEEVEVGHILFALPQTARGADTVAVYRRAEALKDSLERGLVRFEEAARRASDDPSAAQNGGALGYLTGGQVVLPFEDAMYATPVGEIGGPVRTRFGVHLLRVTDRRERRSEIEARHILVQPDSAVSLDSARVLVGRLRQRVLNGEDFAALAREYSDDPGSGPRGGDLGAFGRGRMVPAFEQAAFELGEVGDLSEPVESRFGVHLIQLTGVAERPSYDDAFEDLKRTAQRLPRTALKRQRIGRDYFEAEGGVYNEGLLREAIASVPADSLPQAVVDGGFGPAYDGRALATLGDSTYTLADVAGVYRRVRFGPDPAEEMVDVARQWVDEQAVEQAVLRLEERDPEYARVFRSYTEGVLLFRAAEDSVWTPAKEDEAGLRRYFEARPGQFRWPERRRVVALRAPSDSLLALAAERFDAGVAPAALAAEIDGLRADTLYVADSTQTPLDAVLALDVGERTDVVAERRTRAVYVLDGVEAPRAKTFEEARPELVTGYQDELEEAWEARLRARYSAETFPSRLTALPLSDPAGGGPDAASGGQ
jgi:peptidyl-prolyl cis-trans isomerase SurA